MTDGWNLLSFQARARTLFFFLSALFCLTTGFAASRFTEKQLEALGKYVGKTYWAIADDGRRALFFSAPSPSASSFLPEPKEPLKITEMVQGSAQRPTTYYKVKLGSGREGYIDVDSFLEELNATLVTQDPDRGQKIRAAKEAQEEEKRAAWIRAQPWPEHVKKAVLNRQAIVGMDMKEAREALGKPKSIVKIKSANPLMGEQEQWIYDKGPVLSFTNGLVTRIQTAGGKAE